MGENKKLMKLFLLLVGIVIFSLFIKNIDFEVIKINVISLGLRNILIILVLTLAMVAIRAIQWQFITKKITKVSIGFWFSYMCVLSGTASSSIVPGRFDIAKPFMLKTRYNIKLSESFPAVTIEKIFDFLSLLVILAVGIYFIPSQNIISYKLIFIPAIILISGIFLLAFYPRLFIKLMKKVLSYLPFSLQKISDVIESLLLSFTVLKKKLFLIIISILSVVSNILEIIRYYLVFQLLSVDISIFLVGFVFAGAWIIGVISSIPGGIGVTEISAVGIITAILKDSNSEVIKSIVLIDRVLSYYFMVLVGSLLLVLFGGKKGFIQNKELIPQQTASSNQQKF